MSDASRDQSPVNADQLGPDARALVHTIEHQWARLDHLQRDSIDFADIVRQSLRPLAAEVRAKQGRHEVTNVISTICDDFQRANSEENGLAFPEHVRLQRHFIMPIVLEVAHEVDGEYSALVHLPHPHLPHLSSSESSGHAFGKHQKSLSLGTLKRSISPPLDARPLRSAGIDDQTWAFETAVACGLEHSVPHMPGHPEPKEALDLVAADVFHRQRTEDPLREVVVMTAGHHRVEDCRELFS